MKTSLVDFPRVQKSLTDAGYQSLFQHTQGAGNIFTLWLNLETGEQVLTVSQVPRKFGDGLKRFTMVFELNDVTGEYE